MHNHGFQYRALVVDQDGTTQHGQWFPSETLLRDAMRWTRRDPMKNYFCERGFVRCSDACDAPETVEVLSAL